MEVKIGYPLVARGSLVGWEYERQAERAVAEEEGEIARMQAELAARDHQLQLAEVAVATGARASEHADERPGRGDEHRYAGPRPR